MTKTAKRLETIRSAQARQHSALGNAGKVASPARAHHALRRAPAAVQWLFRI